jgi:hypothetical protein
MTGRRANAPRSGAEGQSFGASVSLAAIGLFTGLRQDARASACLAAREGGA